VSIRIHAVPIDGGPQTSITIIQIGPDTATISKDEERFDVFNVQASADGRKLVCKTQVFFSVVKITVAVLITHAPDEAKVRLTIENAPFHNGITEYVVTGAEGMHLIRFIVDSHFPALMQSELAPA
jgi:hypothetical protein